MQELFRKELLQQLDPLMLEQVTTRKFVKTLYQQLGGKDKVTLKKLRHLVATPALRNAIYKTCVKENQQGFLEYWGKLGANDKLYLQLRIINEMVELVVDKQAAYDDGEDADNLNTLFGEPIPTPAQIKAQLDRYIIGQDEATQNIALAVYDHCVTTAYNEKHKLEQGFQPLEKNNILMYGPTGCGKTEIVRQLGRMLHLPVVIFDTTNLSEASYKGRNVNAIMADLYAAAKDNLEMAAHGIVFLDEFDKMFGHYDGTNRTAVLQELLRVIEGGTLEFQAPRQGTIKINTDGILFICGGAFTALDDIIRARLNRKNHKDQTAIGFQCEAKAPKQPEEAQLPKATTEDFQDFGATREILGRLPNIVRLQQLTEGDLVRIITVAEHSATRQLTQLAQLEGCQIVIEPAAAKAIAHRAQLKNTGARGLRAILAELLEPARFKLAGTKRQVEIVVTADCVLQKTAPVIRELVPEQDGLDNKGIYR